MIVSDASSNKATTTRMRPTPITRTAMYDSSSRHMILKRGALRISSASVNDRRWLATIWSTTSRWVLISIVMMHLRSAHCGSEAGD